ncbi:Uncharacterised protein [Acinetobacter baumannii]|nr:Uncharacterised protein [Acinetobacter baumannii]
MKHKALALTQGVAAAQVEPIAGHALLAQPPREGQQAFLGVVGIGVGHAGGQVAQAPAGGEAGSADQVGEPLQQLRQAFGGHHHVAHVIGPLQQGIDKGSVVVVPLGAKVEDHRVGLVVDQSAPEVFVVPGEVERDVLVERVGELGVVVAGVAGLEAVAPGIALQDAAHLSQAEVPLGRLLHPGVPQALAGLLIRDLGVILQDALALV